MAASTESDSIISQVQNFLVKEDAELDGEIEACRLDQFEHRHTRWCRWCRWFCYRHRLNKRIDALIERQKIYNLAKNGLLKEKPQPGFALELLGLRIRELERLRHSGVKSFLPYPHTRSRRVESPGALLNEVRKLHSDLGVWKKSHAPS